MPDGFTFTIPGLPPTTNHAFVNFGRGRHLSREATVWKNGVKLAVMANHLPKIEGLLRVTLTFCSKRWFTKGGKPRRIDVGNLEKLFIDAVFEALGMEDSSIFQLELAKEDGPEYSSMRVWRLDLNT